MWKTHVENGSCTTEDEVDGALDVTLMVVMSTFVIKQSVVQAVERTMVKRNFISRHKRCHRLIVRRERQSDRCIILYIHHKKFIKTQMSCYVIKIYNCLIHTLMLIPKATKWLASTLKVAEATLSTELCDDSMTVFPLPLPLINMNGLFSGMCTLSLFSPNK